MQPPSTRRVGKQFERLVQALPSQWRELMRQHKAMTFERKLGSAQELLRVILLYCGADLPLKLIATDVTLRGTSMSDEAIRLRLLKSTSFVRAMFQSALEQGQPKAVEGLRFVSVDATQVKGLFRVHLELDLHSLKLIDVEASKLKKGESLRNFTFDKNDVVVPDRGYCSYPGIFKTVLEDQAHLLLRWNHNLDMYGSADASEPLDLCEVLKDLPCGGTLTLPAVVKYSKKSKKKDKRQVAGWLLAYRMSEEEAKKSQRKTNEKHRKKQRKLSPKTLFLSGFVLLFTTLPPWVLSAEDAFGTYRCRWQVELAIKRLKGLVELNKLRALREGKLSELYLFGKLLYLLLLEKLSDSTFCSPAKSLEPSKRQLSPSGPYQLIKKALDASLLDLTLWRKEAVSAALHVLRDRPRKHRKLQCLPSRVIQLRGLLSLAFGDAA